MRLPQIKTRLWDSTKIRRVPGQRYDMRFSPAIFDCYTEMRLADEVLTGFAYPHIPFDVGPIKTVVDIGANVGLASIYFHRDAPKAKFYCFEPNPYCFPLLRENMEGVEIDAQCFNFGLWSRRCKSALDVRPSPIGGSVDSKGVGAHWGVEGDTNTRPIPIELRDAAFTFRQLRLKNIDLLKIDTEGCEVEILTRIAAWIPMTKVLFVEYHSERARRAIDELVFRTHTLSVGYATGPHHGTLGYVLHKHIPSKIAPLSVVIPK